MAPEPPADAEEWSAEQWIEWLRATDPAEERPLRLRPRVRDDASTGVRLFGAAMLGMHEAIYGPTEDPDVVLVTDADGQGRDSDPIRVRLSPRDHRATVVMRPSSAAGREGGDGAEGAAPPPGRRRRGPDAE